MNLIFKKTVVVIIIFLIFCTASNSALAIGKDFLIKYILPDKVGKLLFIGGKKEDKNVKIKYSVTRLTDPYRLVVDIENAVLEQGKKDVNLNNKNLKEQIRIAQFSVDPNVVRIVFTADSEKILDNIRIRSYKNTVNFEFGEIKLAQIPVSSVYEDRNEKKLPTEKAVKEVNPEDKKETSPKIKEDKNNKNTENQATKEVSASEKPAAEEKIKTPEDKLKEKQEILTDIKEKVNHNIVINNIEQHGNRILISGAGIISVTEPFSLDAPSRIIFDINAAVLNSPDLIKTFTLDNKDTVRIAQFDPKTVRIVVESNDPDKYINIFSPDLQSIIISPRNEISFAEFPDNLSVGEIKDIKIIKKDDQTTKFVLMSEKPIIHSIDRLYSPDKLNLNLYNIKKPDKDLLANLEKTEQFHGCDMEPIENFPNGSKWSFPLNKSTIITSKLSLDGRILEINFHDDLTVPLAGTTGKIKKEVVIDPGHGGYDPGAKNNGIYEKDIALDVAKRVKKYLNKAGYYVVMTRETDKTVSLKQRVAITNKAKPDLFLSIHVNSSKNPNIKGVETHWYTPQSRALAMQVQDELVNKLVTPDRGIKNSRFYVLDHTKTPSVLAEIGFISNDIEMYQLMTDERREATAKAIADGIIKYIKAKDSGTQTTGEKKL